MLTQRCGCGYLHANYHCRTYRRRDATYHLGYHIPSSNLLFLKGAVYPQYVFRIVKFGTLTVTHADTGV